MVYSDYKNMTKKQQKKWMLSQEDKANDLTEPIILPTGWATQ